MVVRGWVVGEVGDMDQREQTFSYKRVSSVWCISGSVWGDSRHREEGEDKNDSE
jgi:hypothetical protein